MYYLQCIGDYESYDLEALEESDVILDDYTNFKSNKVDINFIKANKLKLSKNFINVTSYSDGDIEAYDDFLCDNKKFFKPSNSNVVIGNNNVGVKFDYRWIYNKSTKSSESFVDKVYIKGKNGLNIIDFGKGSANHQITINNNVYLDYRKLWCPTAIKGHFGYSLIRILIEKEIVSLVFFVDNNCGIEDLHLNIQFNTITGDLVSCSFN